MKMIVQTLHDNHNLTKNITFVSTNVVSNKYPLQMSQSIKNEAKLMATKMLGTGPKGL